MNEWLKSEQAVLRLLKGEDLELEQRDKLISKLALENEILKKARAIVLPPWNPSNRDYAASAVA